MDYSELDLDSDGYHPLVLKIAKHMMKSLPSDAVCIQDLYQYGTLGLLEACNRFDPDTHECDFTTYAGFRTKGAMLDGLRKGDWTPRNIHKKRREIKAIKNELIAELVRNPTDREIAVKLGVDMKAYHKIRDDMNIAVLLDDLGTDFPVNGVNELELSLLEYEEKQFIAKHIRLLPKRDREILYMRYEEEITQKAIGDYLGVSESRISQEVKRIIESLKKAVKC